MASLTSLGRVQPLYKGTYNSTTTYQKLDNVYYNGDTWVCISNDVIGITPIEGSAYWQKVASKGDTGGIGDPTATASPAAVAGASVTVNRDDPSAAVFNFHFDLPKGDKGDTGIATATGSATTLTAGSDPDVNVTYNNVSRNIDFAFKIPAADGTGIKTINTNLTPDAQGNLTLTPASINAQEVGNYPVLPTDYEVQNGHVLYYNNNGWTTKTINELPTATEADQSKFLRWTTNGASWQTVQQLPASGNTGNILCKTSNTDYSVGWMSAISSLEIDTLFSTAGLI